MVISVLLDTSSEGQNGTLACSFKRQPRSFQVESFFYNYVSFGPGSACDAIHRWSSKVAHGCSLGQDSTTLCSTWWVIQWMCIEQELTVAGFHDLLQYWRQQLLIFERHHHLPPPHPCSNLYAGGEPTWRRDERSYFQERVLGDGDTEGWATSWMASLNSGACWGSFTPPAVL